MVYKLYLKNKKKPNPKVGYVSGPFVLALVVMGVVLERSLTPGLTLHLPSGGQRLRLTESDKLQVQIQAYLDNIFDVGALLEDTETKNAVLEHMEELQEQVALVRAAPEPAESRPAEPPALVSGTGSRCAWGAP